MIKIKNSEHFQNLILKNTQKLSGIFFLIKFYLKYLLI